MATKLKRTYSYLIYTATGLLNFIFMFMSYAVLFLSAGEFNTDSAFSAFGCMKFGEESLATMLKEFIGGMGEDAILAFLGVLVAIIMIIMIFVNIALILAGVVGLVREFAKTNLIPGVGKELVDNVSGIVLTVNFGAQIASALFVILMSICNLHTGSFFGQKISMGMRPGLGMYFLLVIAVAGWVVNLLIGKKKAVPKGVAYKCSTCGSPSKFGEEYCYKCGGKIVAEKIEGYVEETPEEPVEEEAVTDFDYKNIGTYCKNAWKGFLAFCEKSNVSMQSLKTAGLALAVVIVLLIVVAIIPWPQPAAYVEAEVSVNQIYNSEDKETVIFYNGKLADDTIDGRVTYVKHSLDGKTALLGTEDATLYVFTKKGLVSVDENVKAFKLAADGSAVVYVNEDSELVYYNVSKKEKKTVTDEIPASVLSSFAVSPDGKSVLYLEGSDTDSTMCVWTNGKSTEIGDGLAPIGLTSKGKLIYYYDTEKDSIYVQKNGKDPVKLVNDIKDVYEMSIVFNADHTQVLFSANGWYISDNGKEKVKLTSSEISKFGNYSDAVNAVSATMGSFYASTSPVIEFEKQYFLTEERQLCYINKKLEAVVVAENVSSYKATPSYSAVYYTDGDELYRAEGYKKKFKKVADDVDKFYITEDGTKCYFINNDDALMYVKKTGKPKKIADDVYTVTLTHDGYAIFLSDFSIENGGTLYSSRNGSKKKRIAEDVIYFDAEVDGTYYSVDAGDGLIDVYGTKSKVKFKKLLSEVKN